MTEQNKTANSERIEAMFKAGAHFGYAKSKRNASTAPFIFGTKNKTEIIDLEKTSGMLDKAVEFITSLSKAGKVVLFASSKSEAKGAIKEGALSIDMPFVSGRWIGGTITNFAEIKKRLAKFEDLTKQKEKGELSKYTKRERMLIDKEISNLEKMFSGIVGLKENPKALFVVDPKEEINAVMEAKRAGIPVIAIANTDCDIKIIDYPIVANDSSVSSIALIVSEIIKAYKAGKIAKV